MRVLPKAQATALVMASLAGAVLANAPAVDGENAAIRPIVHNNLTVQPQNKIQVDLAKWQARARIVSVSSGALSLAVRMIDNDRRTMFRFAGSDLHPTVILELPGDEPIYRVGAVFASSENARLEVYLLAHLPKKVAQLEEANAISCIADSARPDEATAGFETTNTRYVVFRWTRQHTTKSPFCVAELSAFSTVRPEEIPPIFGETEIHFTNESNIDFSNKLGTVADPPSLAVVSP